MPNRASPILFIHGFGSCGTGNKAQLIKNHFSHQQILTPDLPVNPSVALKILEELIEQYSPIISISSSLGSYYANWLNKKYHLPAVVINPAINAAKTLEPHIGFHKHWCSGETFELTAKHIYFLKKLYRKNLQSHEKYLVLLSKKDEILNFQEAADFYRTQQIFYEKNDHHRFENLPKYLTMIEQFIEYTSISHDRS